MLQTCEPGDRGWVSVSCPAREEEARAEDTLWDHVQVRSYNSPIS